MGEDKTNTQASDIAIIATTKGYVLTGDFRFDFGNEEEAFSQVTARLDQELIEFRIRAIQKIAAELKMSVNFEE